MTSTAPTSAARSRRPDGAVRTVRTRRAGTAARALVACLCLLGVAACSPTRAGNAAVVGEHAISEQQLQDQVDAIVKASAAQGDRSTVVRSALSALVTFQLIDAVAKDQGVQAAPAAVNALRTQARTQLPAQADYEKVIAQQFVAPRNAEQFLRLIVLSDALGRKLVPGDDQDPKVAAARTEKIRQAEEATAKRLGVRINPRYGSWSVKEMTVVPSLSGGLATPEGGASAPADPALDPTTGGQDPAGGQSAG